MADIFDFYVYDDRSIQFELAEPIMLEDKDVTQFRFRIPKSLNGFDMSTWAWWFVYVNARKEKYSSPLTLVDDFDNPEEYSIAIYTVDYGLSAVAGQIRFALEAINAESNGDIVNEWHTKTYDTYVMSTLQGNQAEYSQSETDIISALIAKIQEFIDGGDTPATVVVDNALSITSRNPVQNKVITATIMSFQEAIVTSISDESTDSEIPTAKAVYDIVGEIETLLTAI